MSDTLSPIDQRPDAEFIAITPVFPEKGLLPLDCEHVAQNYRAQQKVERQVAGELERAAWAAHTVYVGPPCIDVLNITLCFDGTNNHEPSDKLNNPPTTSNVARLYHASLGDPEGGLRTQFGMKAFYRYYIQGVGTEFKDIHEFGPSTLGLTMATGGGESH